MPSRISWRARRPDQPRESRRPWWRENTNWEDVETSLDDELREPLDIDPTDGPVDLRALAEHLRISLVPAAEASCSADTHRVLLDIDNLIRRRTYDVAADVDLRQALDRLERLLAPPTDQLEQPSGGDEAPQTAPSTSPT